MEEVGLKAIILAAGKGERLRPLTENLPKCMIELFGKSLLEWQVDTFKSCGISDITVVTGYKEDAINFPGIHYSRNPEYDTTNMVHTLFCAKDQLVGSVIVSYGDIIFEKKILQKLIDSDYDISVVVDKNWREYWKIRFEHPLDDAESLIINGDDNIKSIGQKVKDYSEIHAQYIGLTKFQNNGIKALKNLYNFAQNKAKSGVNPLNLSLPFKKSYMTDLLQGLVNTGNKIKSIPVNNGWLEIDTLQDYEIYKNLENENELKKFISLDQVGT